jgi:hypothetical protein
MSKSKHLVKVKLWSFKNEISIGGLPWRRGAVDIASGAEDLGSNPARV